MKIRSKIAIGAAALTLAGVVAADEAGAHHPEVRASVGCAQNGVATVFVTAYPWLASIEHQINNEIWIQWFDPQRQAWIDYGRGEFTATGLNQIVQPVIVPAPSTQRFRARAAVGWGPNQEFGSAGPGPEITVTVDPRPCIVLTVPTVPTTTVYDTPTTTRPEATPQAPSTVPVITTTTTAVNTATVPEAPVAAAVVSTPRFTG